MIPVFRPVFDGNEKKYLNECIDSGWVSSSGPFVERFEECFAKVHNKRYGIAVSSGTAALQVALWAHGFKDGDAIVLPQSTIISNLVACLHIPMRPIFVDVEITTGNMDMFEAKKVFPNDEVKAIMPVHLFGRSCDMYEAQEIAREHNVVIIEDCSQTWTSPVETGCYSLFVNKFVTCGEGGIILTDETRVATQARRYRDLCHSRERFVHNQLGYNFRMTNLQAAVALAQLEQVGTKLASRRSTISIYKEYLPRQFKLVNGDVSVPWMPLIEVPHPLDAGDIVAKLESNGVEARRFFYPLECQPAGTGKPNNLGAYNAMRLWERWLYLPMTPIKEEVIEVCGALKRMPGITT